MRRSRHGFSLIELVIALVIGGILTGIALSSYGNARGRFAVRGARTAFVTMHARARAQAIERGETVRVVVASSGDSVYLRAGTTTLETIRFGGELGVNLRGTGIGTTLCMNSRGYGDTGCNTFTTSATVLFVQGTDSVSVTILPLGQLVY